MPDEPTELIEAAREGVPGEYSPVERRMTRRMDDALRAVRAAGYPARREAERKVFEAARNVVRVDGNTWLWRSKCVCALCLASRALDAATPKEPTDG